MLRGNLYKYYNKRILVVKDNTFSHVHTIEWFPLEGSKQGSRAKGELDKMELICKGLEV